MSRAAIISLVIIALAGSTVLAQVAPVRVESGRLQGVVEDGLTIYRGIPYAAPPVFGESAGAIAVSQLSASPLAKGLFHAAISQSGGSFGPVRAAGGAGENMQPLEAAEKDGMAWAASVGASSLVDLRAIPADAFLTAAQRQHDLPGPVIVRAPPGVTSSRRLSLLTL